MELRMMKMRMKLVTVLLVVLGEFSSLSEGEVVHSFKQTCPQFFLKKDNKVITPTVLKGDQYKQICQFYEKEYWFATLYDSKNRIPVYSAFTYTFGQRVPTEDYWKIEPQLDQPATKNNREMIRIKPEEEDQFWNQAVNRDYDSRYMDVAYTRGHVFPNSYALSDHQKESTFTLTNAAPQSQQSNTDWANAVEIPMRNNIEKNCDTNYVVNVVTGVVTGNVWLPIKRGNTAINEGVAIPRYYWTAFTCTPIKNVDLNSIPNAYISQMSIVTPTETTKFKTKTMTVDKLNQELRTLYNDKEFCVFGESTVTFSPAVFSSFVKGLVKTMIETFKTFF